MMKFKKIKLSIEKPKAKDWLFILFLAMCFFIPHTKFSVPAMGRYELTIADIILMILTSLTIYLNKGIRKSFFPFFAILILLTFICFFSIAMILEFDRYLLSMIPFLFSLLISFTTLSFFSQGNIVRRMKIFRNILFINLTLSILPVYHQFITGTKTVLFYDLYGWRYAFLAQNPNQYGVCFIVFFFLITLITIKMFPKDLGKLLIFEVFFFLPALFSGSKSTTLVFTVNYLLLMFYYFFQANYSRKVIFLFSFFIIVGLGYKPVVDNVLSKGAQINRALSIFESISKPKEFEIGGGSGHSIKQAQILFWRYPLLGVGMGNKPPYAKGLGPKPGLEIHNTFLLFLAESGILGFSAFFLLFALAPIYTLFSKSSSQFKFIMLVIFALFAAQNVVGMLFRQRWVWLFLCIAFILANVDSQGNYQRSKLRILN